VVRKTIFTAAKRGNIRRAVGGPSSSRIVSTRPTPPRRRNNTLDRLVGVALDFCIPFILEEPQEEVDVVMDGNVYMTIDQQLGGLLALPAP